MNNQINYTNYFDWIPVINLDKRPRRWDAFRRRLAAVENWPFIEPERYSGVDGNIVKCPKWFKAGPGHWGCAQSHIGILREAIDKGYNRILVMEDDVTFADNFSADVIKYLDKLPEDWDQAYLGGQHLKHKYNPATVINSSVLRAYNINRTHCYALQSKFFEPLYGWLTDHDTWARFKGKPIDHYMGMLHELCINNIYAPKVWLAGQVAGISDTDGKVCDEHYWDEGYKRPYKKTEYVNQYGDTIKM